MCRIFSDTRVCSFECNVRGSPSYRQICSPPQKSGGASVSNTHSTQCPLSRSADTCQCNRVTEGGPLSYLDNNQGWRIHPRPQQPSCPISIERTVRVEVVEIWLGMGIGKGRCYMRRCCNITYVARDRGGSPSGARGGTRPTGEPTLWSPPSPSSSSRVSLDGLPHPRRITSRENGMFLRTPLSCRVQPKTTIEILNPPPWVLLKGCAAGKLARGGPAFNDISDSTRAASIPC